MRTRGTFPRYGMSLSRLFRPGHLALAIRPVPFGPGHSAWPWLANARTKSRAARSGPASRCSKRWPGRFNWTRLSASTSSGWPRCRTRSPLTTAACGCRRRTNQGDLAYDRADRRKKIEITLSHRFSSFAARTGDPGSTINNPAGTGCYLNYVREHRFKHC